MTTPRDLLVLVADKNMQFALRGALGRPEALGIRRLDFDFLVHPGRDGGVRKSGAELLRLKRRDFIHALLILDHEGCGTQDTAAALTATLDRCLAAAWGDAAKAIVIEPELDVWMWGSNSAMGSVLEWNREPTLRQWLKARQFMFDSDDKPQRPKEALEAVLRELKIPRSSALYEALALKISLSRCTDSAFQVLRQTLTMWFGG